MVTGPLYDDLGVLRACRAYEEAAGGVWPNDALTAALAGIARPGDRSSAGKIKPAHPVS